MIGAAYEKEISGSSWSGIERTQPNLATACGTFTGGGDSCSPHVGGTDRLYRFAKSRGV